ncbi:MAG: hypothetical protein WCJ40_11020, partial [Planctomycetota bacterium]
FIEMPCDAAWRCCRMWGDPFQFSSQASASDSNDFGVGFSLFLAFSKCIRLMPHLLNWNEASDPALFRPV